MSNPFKMQVKNKYTEILKLLEPDNFNIKPGTGKIRKKNTHLTLAKKKRR